MNIVEKSNQNNFDCVSETPACNHSSIVVTVLFSGGARKQFYDFLRKGIFAA